MTSNAISGKENSAPGAYGENDDRLHEDKLGAPINKIVDWRTFQVELDALQAREKAHTREGDAIAAVRRRLPMVEVDPTITLIGPHGP